jgi:hypothetical protein
MDPAWVTAGVGVIAIVVTMAAGVRNSGAREQQLQAHETRLNKHSSELDDLRKGQAAHGERIAAVEARQGAK